MLNLFQAARSIAWFTSCRDGFVFDCDLFVVDRDSFGVNRDATVLECDLLVFDTDAFVLKCASVVFGTDAFVFECASAVDELDGSLSRPTHFPCARPRGLKCFIRHLNVSSSWEWPAVMWKRRGGEPIEEAENIPC